MVIQGKRKGLGHGMMVDLLFIYLIRQLQNIFLLKDLPRASIPPLWFNG